MEITYEEYKQECLDDIHLEAQIDGTTYDDYFLTDTLGKLVAMGELIDPQPLCVNKKGRNNRIMSFDALAFDESDKSVVLISNEFKDSVLETLTLTEINKIQTRMLNFLEEAYEGTLEKYFDIYDDVLKIGRDIARRMHIDYVNAENDESIDKINLIIITNQDISNSVKNCRHSLSSIKKSGLAFGAQCDSSNYINRDVSVNQLLSKQRDMESMVFHVSRPIWLITLIMMHILPLFLVNSCTRFIMITVRIFWKEMFVRSLATVEK